MYVGRLMAIASALAFSTSAIAQPILVADSGDSAWMLAASVLGVLLALTGLGLFRCGLARARDVLFVLAAGFAVLCVVSLLWVVAGYSLTFGEGSSLLGGIGNLDLADLDDIRDGTTIPESLFALFELNFAVVAPALVIGGVADRVRFGWVVGFTALWSLLVYVPLARWMWGGGWLADLGALDFAGGLAVQASAGIAALVLAVLLGRLKTVAPRHSPALTMVGGGMMWIGWLALIGGSSFAAGADAAGAILNAQVAACAAALAWQASARLRGETFSVSGIVTGALAGLAAISTGAGFVGPFGAILIGLLASIVCGMAVRVMRQTFGIDDRAQVFAINGIGGILGSLIFPVFVPARFGGPGFDEGVTLANQVIAQAIAAGTTVLWSGGVTLVIALMVSMVIPMQAMVEPAISGDDKYSGERGWNFDDR